MHAASVGGGWPTFGGSEPWAPAADIEDAEDAYLVELELPRMDEEQITVEVSEHISAELHNGVLTVRVPKTEKGKARRVDRDHRLNPVRRARGPTGGLRRPGLAVTGPGSWHDTGRL
ncbi:Hsp20/alpha crystallin family protein [Streptomyces caniscabiei]|uniref:Hsp20/alpha crystallin family protein n=1 Tax=Streptomyces caniscabiei TaxID=2746961 RepID=UPI0007C65530|nr:Hsp20/alpha crystallin family protein [Streptomyces caniscabiei]